MPANSERITFPGSQGAMLAARMERAEGEPKATAIFAHCFTCSKDIFAAARIARELAARGFQVLRFDFTGLGASEGEFANTNFSSNVQDLLAAADYLRGQGHAPDLLVGHSLGGAAVLAAAGEIPEVRAVATIGAPADAAHVVHNFSAHLDEIKEKGEAEVTLAGRKFRIRKQFLDDLEQTGFRDRIARLRKALLVFHSPTDNTVGIENASEIFMAAKHPKSFVSLDGADHLLSRHEDAVYVASVLSAWAARYVAPNGMAGDEGRSGAGGDLDGGDGAVIVSETGSGKFHQSVRAGRHRLVADEPEDIGGGDAGPTPYDYVAIGLAACTSMTLRMYAGRKGLPLEHVEVEVRHEKRHAEDCADCDGNDGARIDHFDRTLRIRGDLSDEQRASLIAIADRCPVHRTLESGARIITKAE